jgi:PAS domain S-box-containing protein
MDLPSSTAPTGIFDALPLAALECELDAAGRIMMVRANARAAALLPGSTVPGQPLSAAWPAFAGPGLQARLGRVAEGGPAIEGDMVEAPAEAGGPDHVLWATGLGAGRFLVMLHPITRPPQPPDVARADRERRVRPLFDLMPDPVAVIDRHSNQFLDVNAAWEAQFGYRRKDALGRSALDLGLWVDPAERRELAARVVREGRVLNWPVRMRRSDGELLELELSVTVVNTRDGALVVWVAHDRVAQRRAEAAHRLLEAKLAAAFWATPDAISIARLTDGRLVEINDAWSTLTGYARGRALGRTTVELALWADEQDRKRLVEALVAQWAVRDFEMRLRTRLGEERICRMHATVLSLDGEPHSLAVLRDVTMERQARLALEVSEQRYRSLVDTARDAIVLVRQGIFVQCNEAALTLFGATKSQLLGISPDKVSPERQADGRLSAVAAVDHLAAAARGEPQFFEWRHQRLDGQTFDAEVSINRVDMHGEELLLGMIRDISTRKENERRLAELAGHLTELNRTLEARVQERTEALRATAQELMRAEKLAALGRLVAGVAHELNTPVGTSLLAATTLADRTREFARDFALAPRRSALEAYLGEAAAASELLTRNLQRAGELIAGFKQVAVDRASTHRRRFALDELVAENLLMLKPLLKGAPWQVQAEAPPGLILDSYPGPLGQVLVNLVHNAVQHAFAGRSSGQVWIQASGDGDDHVLLSVRDDGRGIEPEALGVIFEPFYTTALGRGGSGLGLHIVHTLATTLLGGRIEVSSAPGEGACFTLRLPRVAPDLPAALVDPPA